MTPVRQIGLMIPAAFAVTLTIASAAAHGLPFAVYGPVLIVGGYLAARWTGHITRAVTPPNLPTVWVVYDPDDFHIMGVTHTLPVAKQVAQEDMGDDAPPLEWRPRRSGRYTARCITGDGRHIGSYVLLPYLVKP